MEINRKRVAKRLASGLMAGALALGGLAVSGSSPAGAVPIEIGEDLRVSGDDRYATSANVAEVLEDEVGSDLETVIVASGENYPDALAASALAGDESAILLVRPGSIPSTVRDRMFRLADSVEDVIIVGGEAAVSAAVEEELVDIFDNADVDRLSGDNRYATASAIADEVGLDAGTVALVSGQSYADALSIGPWAATQSYPILLANSSGLPDETVASLEDALDEDDATKVVIVGGTSVVSADVEDSLVELGFAPANVVRVAGADRYATNLNWQLENLASAAGAGPNKYLTDVQGLELGGHTAMLVSGQGFADALSAAPLAAHEGAHLILTSATGGSSALTLAALSGGSGAITTQSAIADAVRSAAAVPDSALGTHTASLIAGATTPAGATANYSLKTLWVIGGTSAVPDSVVTTMDAVADASLDCSIIVNGGNEDSGGAQEGPLSFILSFGGNLSNAPAGGTAEYEYLSSEENLEDLIEINGVDDVEQASQTGLDLSGDGFEDAILVAYAAGLEQGDEIEFLGYEENVEDYAAANGIGLRELSSCAGEVARDRTAPELSVTGVVGFDQIIVEFDEPLADGGDSLGGAWADTIATGLDDGDGGGNAWACINVGGANTTFSCEGDGTPGVVATGDLSTDLDGDDTDAAITFFDDAGNEIAVAGSATNYATAAADGEGGSIDDLTVTCKRVAGKTRLGEKWDDLSGDTNPITIGNGFVDALGRNTTDSGVIDLALSTGQVRLVAQSGISGVAANDWTVTVVHERGLLRPTVTVDGTDATVTIDKYVHTGADIETAINVSSIGKGGLAPIWKATASSATNLIDTDILEEAQDSASAGSTGEASQACLVTITLDAPMAVTPVDDDSIDAAGDIRLRVGGTDQTVTYDYAGVLAGTNQAVTGGYVIYGQFNTSDTGIVRVDIRTSLLDDTGGDTDSFETAEIS